MENLDLIILSTVVSTLFLVFGIVVYREFTNPENFKTGNNGGPRANMIKFVGSLFDQTESNTIPLEEKKVILYSIKRTISDMESDGVYFPEDIKEKLEQKRKELMCEYSGLPSPLSYESYK